MRGGQGPYRFPSGALRLAVQLGSSASERDDIVVHSFQLLLAAMRGRASCPHAVSSEVLSCVGGVEHGYAKYTQRVRGSRDAATRLFGLELMREFCRGDTSGRCAQLAEEYYASAADIPPLHTNVLGSTSAKHRAVFREDPLETCWYIRHVSRGSSGTRASSSIPHARLRSGDSCWNVL